MMNKFFKNVINFSENNLDSRINYNDQIIFIHIPKNGGTSISKAFDFNRTSHIKTSEILVNRKNRKFWKSHFSFAIVRHPIPRFISLYNYARMEVSYYHNNINPENSLYGIHEDFQLLKDKTISECVDLLIENKLKHDKAWNHWMPQYSWVYIDNELLVDRIYKIEELDFLRHDLNQRFGVILPKQRYNVSNSSTQQIKQLSDRSKQKLLHYYRKDLELFNYSL